MLASKAYPLRSRLNASCGRKAVTVVTGSVYRYTKPIIVYFLHTLNDL